VGLRGAGYSYDGYYYINSVTHTINRKEYKQSFNLTRDGTGSPVQRV
jgi:phage protein D